MWFNAHNSVWGRNHHLLYFPMRKPRHRDVITRLRPHSRDRIWSQAVELQNLCLYPLPKLPALLLSSVVIEKAFWTFLSLSTQDRNNNDLILLANVGGVRDAGLFSGSGRSLGVGNGNPLQYSWMENPMDRGAWQASVYGASRSWTWLSTHTHTIIIIIIIAFLCYRVILRTISGNKHICNKAWDSSAWDTSEKWPNKYFWVTEWEKTNL